MTTGVKGGHVGWIVGGRWNWSDGAIAEAPMIIIETVKRIPLWKQYPDSWVEICSLVQPHPFIRPGHSSSQVNTAQEEIVMRTISVLWGSGPGIPCSTYSTIIQPKTYFRGLCATIIRLSSSSLSTTIPSSRIEWSIESTAGPIASCIILPLH